MQRHLKTPKVNIGSLNFSSEIGNVLMGAPVRCLRVAGCWSAWILAYETLDGSKEGLVNR